MLVLGFERLQDQTHLDFARVGAWLRLGGIADEKVAVLQTRVQELLVVRSLLRLVRFSIDHSRDRYQRGGRCHVGRRRIDDDRQLALIVDDFRPLVLMDAIQSFFLIEGLRSLDRLPVELDLGLQIPCVPNGDP